MSPVCRSIHSIQSAKYITPCVKAQSACFPTLHRLYTHVLIHTSNTHTKLRIELITLKEYSC